MVRCADGITDMDVCYTGDCYDGTDACLCYFYLVETVEFIKLAYFYFLYLIGIMVVNDDSFLVYFDAAVVYFAHTYAAYILVVVDGGDKYLCACFGITFGSRDVIKYSLEEGVHICAGCFRIHGCGTCLG